MTAAETREITAARKELERLDKALEDTLDIHDENPLRAERDTAKARLSALQEAAKAWDRQLMAHAGVALTIDHDGRQSSTKRLIKRSALKALNKLRHSETQIECFNDEGSDGALPAGRHCVDEMSKALVQTLTTARTRAIRCALKERPHVALTLIVHMLQQGRLRDRVPGVAITARAVGFEDENAGISGRDTPAQDDAADAASQWRARLSEPTAALLARLAALVSQTVDLTHIGLGSQDRRVQVMSDAIAAAVDLDMAGVWELDEAFWIRAPKALALSAPETSPTIASPPPREKAAQLAWFGKMKKSNSPPSRPRP